MSLDDYRLPVFSLEGMAQSHIGKGLKASPEFRTRYKYIVRHVIRTIHAIPTLFHNACLEEIELYLGRSSPSGVLRRFIEHRDKRQQEYGVIVFRTPGTVVRNLESMALRIIDGLRNAGALCVRNIRTDMGGRANAGGVVYMTWRFQEPMQLLKPSTALLDTLAIEAATASKLDIEPQEVRTGLRSIRSRKDVGHLYWPRLRS